jgi:hypothetical protein
MSPPPIYVGMSEPPRVVDQIRQPTRDESLENLITNHSIIFTGIFDEAFSAIADRMTGASGEGASEAGNGPSKGVPPDVLTQIGYAISAIRDEVAAEMPEESRVFAQYVSSPAFDRGIEIIEEYDFGRPKLTEKLSDEVLASYVFLLKSGDKQLGQMFKELADWQTGLPKPPWAF